ncbi:MAG: extracellular solute-binding protein [Spirochaetales bacterium]|nr:extracellular solute-binding protein [Spirochaetales bacterium]
MKKTLAWVLLSMMCLSAVYGAGEAEESGEVELLFWSHMGEAPAYVEAFADSATEAFAEIGMGHITVRGEIVEYSRVDQRYISAFTSGQGPDIFFARAWDYALDYGLNPIAVPFSEEAQRVWDERLSPGVAEQAVIEGKRFGIPWQGAMAQILFYNVDHFIEAGLDPDDPPSTLEEFVEAARALTQYGPDGEIIRAGYGMRHHGSMPATWGKNAPVYDQFGARILAPDYSTSDGYVNSPESLEAFRFIHDLAREHRVINTSFDVPETAFRQGLVSMIFREVSFIEIFETDTPDLNFDIAPIPSGPAGHFANVVVRDSWNYMVNSQSEYVDEIMAMFVALADPKYDVQIHRARNSPPALLATQETEWFRTLPYSEIIPVYQQSSPMPEYGGPGGQQARGIAAEELVRMVLGEQTPEEAVTNAQRRIDQFLADLP